MGSSCRRRRAPSSTTWPSSHQFSPSLSSLKMSSKATSRTDSSTQSFERFPSIKRFSPRFAGRPNAAEMKLCKETLLPLMKESYYNDCLYLDDPKYISCGFPADQTSEGKEKMRNQTIAQENQQRCKILTGKSAIRERAREGRSDCAPSQEEGRREEGTGAAEARRRWRIGGCSLRCRWQARLERESRPCHDGALQQAQAGRARRLRCSP